MSTIDKSTTLKDGSNPSLLATVTSSNALKVDGSAVTQPISNLSLTSLEAAGGFTIEIPVTGSTGAYSVNNSIGGKFTLNNAIRVTGKSTVLQSIQIMDRSNQKPAGNLLFFNTDPTSATIIDKSGFSSSINDKNICGIVPIGTADYITIGAANKAYASIGGLGKVLTPLNGTNLFSAFVTNGTPSLSGVNDLQFQFGFIRD